VRSFRKRQDISDAAHWQLRDQLTAEENFFIGDWVIEHHNFPISISNR